MKPSVRASAVVLLLIALQCATAYLIRFALIENFPTNFVYLPSGLEDISGDLLFALLLGGLLGQLTVTAALVALWHGMWRQRLAAFLGLGALLIYGSMLVEVFMEEDFDTWWWMYVVFQYCLLSGTFWLPRLLGWRLVAGSPEKVRFAYLPKSQVVCWVGGLGLLLVVGIYVYLSANYQSYYRRWRIEVDFVEGLSAALLMTLVCLPGALGFVCVLYWGKRSRYWRLSLLLLLSITATLSVIASIMGLLGEEAAFSLAFEGALLGVVMLLAGFLALGGWRLERAGANLFASELPSTTRAEPTGPMPGTLELYQDSFRRHGALWIVLIGHCLFSGLVGLSMEILFRNKNYGAVFAMGVLGAQPVLGAIWLSLYRAPLRILLPAIFATAIASSGLFLAAIEVHEFGKMPATVAIIFLLGLGLLILVMCIPFLIWRALARRVIVGPPSRWPGLSTQGQFTLADLMLWTAGCAILFGLSRWLLDFDNFFEPSDLRWLLRDLPEGAFIVGMGVVAALPELLLALALLHPGREKVWVYVGLGLELAYCLVMGFLFMRDLDNYFEFLSYYVVFKVGGGGAILASLALLINNGYRTVRVSAPPTVGPAASESSAAASEADSTTLPAPADNADEIAAPNEPPAADSAP